MTDFDSVYNGPDADEIVTIRMTRRQWWHLDDWRAEFPDRYPKRAAERNAAWAAIGAATACANVGTGPGTNLTKAEHDELAPPDRKHSAYHNPPR